jgi:hypothetical protein
VIVHHLGIRWTKQKFTSFAKKLWASKKMAGDGSSLGEIILEPVDAEPVSEDEFDFGPDGGEEVNEETAEAELRGVDSSDEEEPSETEQSTGDSSAEPSDPEAGVPEMSQVTRRATSTLRTSLKIPTMTTGRCYRSVRP